MIQLQNMTTIICSGTITSLALLDGGGALMKRIEQMYSMVCIPNNVYTALREDPDCQALDIFLRGLLGYAGERTRLTNVELTYREEIITVIANVHLSSW